MKKYLAFLLISVMMMSVTLTGCTKPPSSEPTAETPQKDSLIVAVRTETSNFDPQNHVDFFSYITDVQIYDSLQYLNDFTKEYENKLAESIEKSEDAKSVTVKLKKGVLFHNGEEMKASDVKFSYDRAIASSIYGTRVGMIDVCNVIDDYTVQIVLKYPYAPIDAILGGVFIVNEKAVNDAGDEYGNSAKGIVGTGAYKLVSWDKGQQVVLTRNDNYFLDKAKIKDIIIKTVPDLTTAALALEKGEIDYMWEIEPDQIKTLQNNPDIKIINDVILSSTMLIMNCSKPPFDNVDLRKAISYAIDRDAATIVATDGTTESMVNYLQKGAFGTAEDVIAPSRDLEKAKEYLAKAGYPNGLNITILSQDDPFRKYAPVIQANLAEVGIVAEIEMLEFNAAIDRKFSGDYELSDVSISNRFRDGDFLYQWFKSDSSNNLFFFKNDEFDELVVEGRQELDPKKREAIYRRTQEILRDEAVVVPIYQLNQFAAFNNGLEGIAIVPILINEFRNIYWK